MKKLLLLTLSLIGIGAFAQDGLTCATPLTISTGTFTCPQITGTYVGSCLPAAPVNQGGSAAPKSIWFTYTSLIDGEVTISSDLPGNDGVTKSNDTRLSVLTGSCATLACHDSNDDIDFAGNNLKSIVTVPVKANTPYFIMWDSGWSDLTFDFTVTFNSLVCIRPAQSDMQAQTNITNSSVDLNWTAAIGNPDKYDVEYGAVGFTQGTLAGTIATSNSGSTSVSLNGLPSGGNLEFYYRSACTPSFKSAWVGPFPIYLAKTLPYSNDFENATDPFDGFSPSAWSLGNAASGAQSGTIYSFSSSSATAATNAFLFSRAISLQANEQVTITFYTRLGAAGDAHSLRLLVDDGTAISQLGTSISVSTTSYVLQTRTYTATTAGTYYFIFNDNTPIVVTPVSMRLDTVGFTSVLGTNDFLTSKFSVYPNPVNNVINFTNDANAVVSTIEMTDLNGRIIKSVEVNATEGQISVSDLSTGIYMMRISTDQGMAVKKIVKE